MSDHTTQISNMTPGELRLSYQIKALKREIELLQQENSGQASKDRQDTHYRTLFGSSPDKDGLVQKVAKLMTFMKVSLWAASIVGAGLLAYLAKLIIGLIQSGAPQ